MVPNAGRRGTLRDSFSPWDRECLHKRHLYFQKWVGFPPTEKCGVGTEGRRGNGIPGKGTIVNKGPVVGLCLVYSRESCDTGAEHDWEVLRLDRWAGATAGGGPWLPHGGFSYGVGGGARQGFQYPNSPMRDPKTPCSSSSRKGLYRLIYTKM